MQETIYANRWGQAINRPSGISGRGRAFLRSVTLHAAACVQSFPTTPFLRSLYCHYVFDDQVEAFERLIVQLKAIGTFVDADTLLEMLYGRQKIPGPCFHLSFDDGFRNIYTNAFPVVQRHGVPAIFFIPSALVEANPELVRSYLESCGYAGAIELVRWDELRRMQEGGIEIGSHGRTHARFSAISSDPAGLREEIYGSKSELEEHLGRECRFISWPYGNHGDADAISLELIADAGYAACFGGFRGQIQPQATDRLRIPRHHFETQWPSRHVRYFALGGNERSSSTARTDPVIRKRNLS
jgi:peptidoglycan/xylan/chitin deacetylase (PgdA/CDA1 family)